MSYAGRDEQGSYYPSGGPYSGQTPPEVSRNMLGMYQDQQSNMPPNQSIIQAHLQQMAYLNSQVNSSSVNHHQPQSQGYYYPTGNDYSHQQQNSSATYQNQYSYPPPNHYSYTSAPGYTNYPPPPPPPVQLAPPNPGSKDQKGHTEEKNSFTVQEAPSAPVKREQEVEEEKEIKKSVPIMVGKRRGGRVLPTGVVKKQRTENEGQGRSDAWSQYMAEVRRYKEQSCEEERKNRPLVK